MAYPFVPMPSWEEFLAQLAKEFGVEVRYSKIEIKNTDGESIELIYLLRKVGKKVKKYPLKYTSPKDIVTPSVLRSICTELEIDPAYFGFTLG